MTINRAFLWVSMAAALAACESGDINLAPTNIDNSTGGGGGAGAVRRTRALPTRAPARRGKVNSTARTARTTRRSSPEATRSRSMCGFRSSRACISFRTPWRSARTSPPVLRRRRAPDRSSSSMRAARLRSPPRTTICGSIAARRSLPRGRRRLRSRSAASPTRSHTPPDLSTCNSGAASCSTATALPTIAPTRSARATRVTSRPRASRRTTAATTTPTAPASLRYVVLKHTGFEVAPGDELNGITFNAVGSGTVVENVEVYSGYDDGVEFFGGAVNVTNLVAMYIRDDSIDFSDGYVGTVKNALVIHPPQNGNRCIEGDNIAETRLPPAAAARARRRSPGRRSAI